MYLQSESSGDLGGFFSDILELKKLVALDDDFTGVELSLESGFGFDFTESFVDSAGLISVWQVLGELSSCVGWNEAPTEITIRSILAFECETSKPNSIERKSRNTFVS